MYSKPPDVGGRHQITVMFMAQIYQARASTQYRRTSVFLRVPEDAKLVFSRHVIFRLGVDRRTEGAVEVVRARNVGMCQKAARLHLEPPNDHRLQLGVRDGVYVAQKVDDQFEQLVDVPVRVVDR